MAIDPLAVATSGYMNLDGSTNPLSIVMDGYIDFQVEILPPDEKKGLPRRWKITPKPGDQMFEEEELILVLTMFMKYESQGLFD